MPQFLAAKEQPIEKVFSRDYAFNIPGYQRPYSWSTEQASTLLDDLLAAVDEAPRDLGEAMPYFLGSIVLIKQDAKPDAEVVDGQQRLTTLTLLLSAIRHATEDSGLQSEITDFLYEKGRRATSTPDRFRLTLRERDKDFFQRHVQKEQQLGSLLSLNSKLSEVEARFQSNARVFVEQLARLTQAQLERLLQFIVTRCFLVVVATPDLDSAYRIFNVMNSRGLDLSATDVLKADIVGRLPEAMRDTYTHKWEDAEEFLGSERFNDLFSHIRTVYLQAKSQSTLLKDFRVNVPSLRDALKNEPQKLMDTIILPMAEDYAQIASSQFSGTRHVDAINDRLQWLNRLEFKDWVPPTLAFLLRHRNDADKVLAYLTDLERLTYSLLLCRENINYRIRRFAEITKAIEAGSNLHAPDAPLQLSAQEQMQTVSVLDGPLYGQMPSRVLALVLKRLDQLLSAQNATYSGDSSVEHVLPQNPDARSTWCQWIPDEAKRVLWVHRLGNLVLLSRNKNSAAQNYDFDKKKTAYFTGKSGVSNYALTTQVLGETLWDIATLERRQKELVGKLQRHWRLESAAGTASTAPAEQEEAIFEVRLHGELLGRAKATGTGLTILKGSRARAEWPASESTHSYARLRETMRADGRLISGSPPGFLVFACDIEVAKPSIVSALMLGRPDNGNLTLKLQGTSTTYSDWLAQRGLLAPAE